MNLNKLNESKPNESKSKKKFKVYKLDVALVSIVILLAYTGVKGLLN